MQRTLILIFIVVSCSFPESEEEIFDIQGHRGARGMYPENTISGFIYAINAGATTLEMDLVVSADNQLVVSHEPYMSANICLLSSGEKIPKDSVINLYELTYAEIVAFDCGKLGNPFFSSQRKISAVKPLLSFIIDSVESYLDAKDFPPVGYNIELKTKEETDNRYHPTPIAFSRLVMQMLKEKEIEERTTIQSFDFRTLQFFHQKYPDISLAALVDNEMTWEENINKLGFTPDIYSCYYPLLSVESTKEIQDAGMKVIPWTVNETETIERMIDLGVNGIISDYPIRIAEVLKQRND